MNGREWLVNSQHVHVERTVRQFVHATTQIRNSIKLFLPAMTFEERVLQFYCPLKSWPGARTRSFAKFNHLSLLSFYVKIFAIKNRAFLLCEFRKLAHTARGVLL